MSVMYSVVCTIVDIPSSPLHSKNLYMHKVREDCALLYALDPSLWQYAREDVTRESNQSNPSKWEDATPDTMALANNWN